MDLQNTILKGIKELLYLHDYLVLPEFGGFVLKSKPAHFSLDGNSIVPASKTVSFNIQLKQNDGVLTQWLQNYLSCSAAEAIKHVSEFSSYCSSLISAKKRLNMEGLGFFYVDFEANLCFEPLQDTNFLSESFGLGTVHVHVIEDSLNEAKTSETQKESLFTDRVVIKEMSNEGLKPTPKRFRHLIQPIVVVSLSLSLLLLVISNLRVSGLLYSSVLGSDTKGLYEPAVYINTPILPSVKGNSGYVADANGIAGFKISDKKSLPVRVIENRAALNLSSENSIKLKHKKFEIVFGCFTVLANAKRMHKDLQSNHLQTSISEKNSKGMYVISKGDFESKEEAIEQLEKLKASYPKAWIKSLD